ncbi:MAG TPA: carboxypeptidase-like regulatory domain-containing protein [Candidatus Limnocylindrales bacterium]|nr:carboxypeptidase-like regulatory domain-containing protein [Candidatus Limnocylindrales bacterium]
MKRSRKFEIKPADGLRWLFAVACLVFAAWGANAGTVSGTVRNGTTGKVAAGVDVILIQLQGGMQPVANTKTDSEGRFHFDNPGLGQAPMLIRAVYRGVNYHEPVPPGKTTADVEVFEPTDKPDAFAVTAHAIVVQPSATDLSVGEIYNITNNTQPPKAYFREDGSFLFSLPDGAQLGDVSAQGASGMPVTQGTIDKGKNEEAISFPFRPGDSGVRISYKLPYSGNQARVRFVSPYASDRLAIFAPPGVQISGDGLSPAGQDQGFSVYMRESVAANTPVTVSIAGVGSPVQSGQSGMPGDDSQNSSANSRLEQGANGEAAASATTMPARLDSLKWVLVGGFVAIFALGFVYLWRRPQLAVAPAGSVAMAPAAASVARATDSAARVMPAGSASSASAVDDVKRQVTGSLDEMKEKLFRLELRHQAGTIGDAEYAAERQRIEQLLRDLVRG